MCIGGGGSKKPPKLDPPKPPPPPPVLQKPQQAAAEALEVDKRRNMNQGAGPNNVTPTESMLTGTDGVTEEEMKKKLGGVNLLGGRG